MQAKVFHLTAKNRDALITNISRLDLASTDYDIKIEKHKTTRSIEQNRRLWKLYGDIANHIGYTPDEIHQLAGYKFLRYQKGNEEFITSTTKLDTKRMAEYQDALGRWASELGIWIDY